MSLPTLSSSRAELQHTLCFVLQHSDLCHNIKALCSLLCVSTSFTSSVHACCSGCASLTVATDFYPGARLSDKWATNAGLPQWLAKHAVLLHQLLHQSLPAAGEYNETQGLAAALSAAAALPKGLKLQSLRTDSLPLLAAVASCSSLTKLQLQLDPDDVGFASGTSVNPFSCSAKQQALAAVTGLDANLRTLQLSAASQRHSSFSKDGWFDSFVQQALPKLTALTRLDIEDLRDSCVLNHAPAQLVELECNSTNNKASQALVLGHLTACTTLTMESKFLADGDPRHCRRVIQAGDTLPPSLQRLCAFDCQSTTPLLPLSQLTELSMSRSSTHAAELSRLSVLTNLQKVALWYASVNYEAGAGHAADRAAAGWGGVPGLRELVLDRQLVDPRKDTLECLGKLTGLTRLVWSSSYVCHVPPYAVFPNGLAQDQPPVCLEDAGLHRIAAALASATNLRQLTLDQFMIDHTPYGDGCVDEPAVLVGLKALVQALNALPKLGSHTIQDEHWGWSSAGIALCDRIVAGEDVDSEELSDFESDFWAGLDEPVYVDDSASDVYSDDVSVEVMAADPVSEEYGGGVYDDDAVWEGDDDV